MPLPLLLAAAPAVMQGVQGLAQWIGGKKAQREAEANRPQYEIPDAVSQAMAIARAQAADPFMPGEGRMSDRNSLAAVNAGRAAIEGGAGISAMAGIQAAEMAGAERIGIASAQDQRADMAAYQGQLGQYGGYQDQQWQMNKYAPWADKNNEAKERIGAGTQNMFGALNSLANIGLGQNMLSGGANVTPNVMAADTQSAVQATQRFNQQYQNNPMVTDQYDPYLMWQNRPR